MTTEIQQNRYDQLLRRVGGMIGPGSKVSEVLSELFPMIDVENVPAELLLLGGTRLAWGGGSQLGAAGQSARAQLFNPVDSSTLVVLTSVRVAASGTGAFRWGSTSVSFAASNASASYRDTRLSRPSLPVGVVHSQSSAALATPTNQSAAVANSDLHLWDPNAIIVLSPGEGWQIGTTSVATTLNFSFSWRERTAEQSELDL